MRKTEFHQALDACHVAARRIRAVAMDHGAALNEEDHRGLFALAALIEGKTWARTLAHGIVTEAVDDVFDLLDKMIAVMDALDAPAEDREPWLGAPERSDWKNGYDQTGWSDGGTDDREEENEHGTDLDHGEVDDCPRPHRKTPAPVIVATNALPWRTHG